MKYFTLTLCFLLPVMMRAGERTVPLGNQQAIIGTEETKTDLEIKKPNSPLTVIPFDKYSQYGRTPRTEQEIRAIQPEAIEEDDRGWKKQLFIEKSGYYDDPLWVEFQVGTGHTGTPHFMDLQYIWRCNSLLLNNLHEGNSYSSYEYRYNYNHWITGGGYFEWPRRYESYFFRFQTSHGGYVPQTPGGNFAHKFKSNDFGWFDTEVRKHPNE